MDAPATTDSTLAPEPRDPLDEAAQAAMQLATMLDDLVKQAGQEGAEARHMAERLKQLEARDSWAAEWRQGLQRAVNPSLTVEEVRSTLEVLEGLVQKPADLLVMVRLSEKAAELAGIVRAYAEVRRLMEASEV